MMYNRLFCLEWNFVIILKIPLFSSGHTNFMDFFINHVRIECEKSPKCYWIKKQEGHFCIHLSNCLKYKNIFNFYFADIWNCCPADQMKSTNISSPRNFTVTCISFVTLAHYNENVLTLIYAYRFMYMCITIGYNQCIIFSL